MSPTHSWADPQEAPPAPPQSAPVFVDQSGTRGRRLRGLGWLIGFVCTLLSAAMTSSLIGSQSQAPAMHLNPSAVPAATAALSPSAAAPGATPSGTPTAAPTPAAAAPDGRASARSTASGKAGTATPSGSAAQPVKSHPAAPATHH